MSTSISPQEAASPVPLGQDLRLVSLVSVAHMVSHFSQLLLPPLFPWLKDEFSVSYAELGFLMTVFFVVSCAVQALSGFFVDRMGPRPILFVGLALLGLASMGYALSTTYWMLALCAALAGAGNGVFHPADYTFLNRKVSAARLGHAYSAHGISGSLGWALAPALVVGLTLAYSWRTALVVAGGLTFLVLAVLVWNRGLLVLSEASGDKQVSDSFMGFLKIPAVWMCFAFFFFSAVSLGAVTAFAPEAARRLHNVPLTLVAVCLTFYMVSSATGMVVGGFLAANPARCERVVASGYSLAACMALLLALADLPASSVPVIFGLMGFVSGLAGPSRDLLVKASTPANATGRVYGVVYAGLDIGQAASPVLFGLLMDQGYFRGVLLGLALMQLVLVLSAFGMQRVRRA